MEKVYCFVYEEILGILFIYKFYEDIKYKCTFIYPEAETCMLYSYANLRY